jgi:demethylmenaquinone methyltransferase/2-methoxy-6-polyprenyl-1,4-benzoquinol methylase
MTRKFWNTVLFLWAAFLCALVGLLACIFILLKESLGAKRNNPGQTIIFLADKRRAILFYTVLSKVYDIINPFFYDNSMRREVVELTDVRHDFKVLDVGCGTGYTTEAILRRVGHGEVVGIDLTPRQLRKSMEKLKSENFALVRGDAENLPFRENTFDATISIGAVEYFPNPENAVKEMRRVVKSNGKIAIGGPEFRWFKKLSINRMLYTPAKEELTKLCKDAGLTNVKAFLTGVDTYFGTNNYAVLVIAVKS